MRRARAGEESIRAISTFRRILGRPKSPPTSRRAATLATLRLLLLASPFLLLISVVSAWWLGALKTALTKPGGRFQLESMSFTLPRGQGLTIGRAELMQRPGLDSAESDHIRFQYTANGDVRIANLAKQRHLSLLRYPLETGAGSADRIELSGPTEQTTRIIIGGREAIFRNVTGTGFEVEVIGIGRFQATIGLGWNRVQSIGADGRPAGDLAVCAARGWRDGVQATVAPLAVLFGLSLDQPVLRLGGDRSCQVGRTFQLALPRSDGIDELLVSMETENRWGNARRLFLSPIGQQAHNLVIVERYPAGCTVGDAHCRTSAQAGLSGTSWLVMQPNAPPTREMKVWRFVAGRTTYAIAVTPIGAADVHSRYPKVRVALTPLSNIQQFSSVDCGWYLIKDAQASPRQPTDDAHACPERLRDAGQALQIEVQPTQARLMFDRQIASRPLGQIERILRLAVLALAIAIGLWLTVPAATSDQNWFWAAAGIRRVLKIWPVFISVAISAAPDALQSAQIQVPATTSFALTITNWTFAGYILALVPRTGRQLALMWAVLMGLAAIGSVSLATIGTDVGTTRAAGYLIKHKLLFLDLLPPIALSILTARQEALRPLLASIVLDNRKRFAVIRWLPAIALIGLFAAWLTVGTQQGLGNLQPVEGGKFWFIIIVGAVLVSLERASRREALTATYWSRTAAMIIIAGFMAALYLVPFLRNDYSPLLIISATGLVLLLVRFLPDLWRWIVAYFRVLSERLHLPMRMRPPVYEPLIPWGKRLRVRRGAKFLAGIGLSIIGLTAATLMIVLFGGIMLALALHLEPTKWPAAPADQIQALEHSLGIGRRVPIERMLTWVDLRYDSTTAKHPRASYRDIGFQVIRSRVEIANAKCQMSSEMLGGAVLPGLGTLPNRAIESIARAAARLFAFDLAPDSPLCAPQKKNLTTDTVAASTILTPRGAYTIPAAENDFAAAYLIARHGVASAVLLFAFQFAFFSLAAAAYVRLIRVQGGDASDAIVRYLLSVLLAATCALFVIQWFLAWSNALGLFPVMGQPMTWLSYGTSHHLFMALPGAVTILLALRYTVPSPARRSFRAPPL
jgi:cell division protein FtsW (lipid II flippase)